MNLEVFSGTLRDVLAILQKPRVPAISISGVIMLWTIVVVLLLLWLLGNVMAYTAGGLIHLLIVIALIVVVVRLVQGRKVL